MLNRLTAKWRRYRYRFVPWLIFKLPDRSVRRVTQGEPDHLISGEVVESNLLQLFKSLQSPLKYSTTSTWKSLLVGHKIPDEASKQVSLQNLKTLYEQWGFVVERCESNIDGGGTGVKVTAGVVPAGTVVALYPGTVYQPYEPLLFQSVGNPYLFRCIDGLHIDGNHKKLSKYIFRSCSQRDRHGPLMMSDTSWLSQYLINPLALGQYVNNHNKEFPANVAYQEFNVPNDFPGELRQFIPNIYYSPSIETAKLNRVMRLVVLVSTREIQKGEELYSSYFTIVH